MADPALETLMTTFLQTRIVEVLNSTPDAIELMVKAALTKSVGKDTGSLTPTYGETKIPYLEWLVGDQIRRLAEKVVFRVVNENAELVEQKVREALTHTDVVNAIVKSFVNTSQETWRINVNFEAEKTTA